MSFEHPEFFLLVMIIPLMIAGAILASRGRGRAWKRLVAERLRPILVRERPQALRWISFSLMLLGFALLITAFAEPIAGYEETPDTIRGRNILLAVDVSRSMLATDVTPSRLAAARAAALELLERFPSDRVGVIAFSGVAWLQAPLTVDHDAVRETFQQLEFVDSRNEWIPRSGSDLSAAVDLAVKTLRETGQRNNALVVLSDGESHSGNIEDSAEYANEAGITIFTAGFGTDEGGFIPDPRARDGQFHDREGNLVLTRLDSQTLNLLARGTGGFYTTGSGRHFSENLEVAVSRLDQFEMEGLKRRVPIPRFQWFLVPAMLLLLVGMLLNTSWRFAGKPAAGLVAALLAVAPSPRSDAGLIPRTDAEAAYSAGDYSRALELFEAETTAARGERQSRLYLGEAAAAYRLGKLGRASRAYSQALLSRSHPVQEQAHYGLGNTQFYKGLAVLSKGPSGQPPTNPNIDATVRYWRDSIQHYDGVLALNPDNKQAHENRERVKQRLEELLKEQQRQREQQNQSQSNDPSPDPGEQEDPKQTGSSGQPNNSPADQNPNQTPDQSPSESTEPSPNGENDPPNPQDTPRPDTEDSPPRPGESPEDYARRILTENADFQDRPIPLRIQDPPRPAKDW